VKVLNDIAEIKHFIETNRIALLYLTSESCSVCKVIYPLLVDLLNSYPNAKAASADIKEHPFLAGEYSIFTIPCVLIFIEGKEIMRSARYINIKDIGEQINRYYNLIFDEQND